MANLTVRNLDDDLVAALQARAARTGRSAEAEHRRILENALRPVTSGFFDTARMRRVKLPPAMPETTEFLRTDRARGDA